jgi:hypothetical protein
MVPLPFPPGMMPSQPSAPDARVGVGVGVAPPGSVGVEDCVGVRVAVGRGVLMALPPPDPLPLLPLPLSADAVDSGPAVLTTARAVHRSAASASDTGLPATDRFAMWATSEESIADPYRGASVPRARLGQSPLLL